MSEQKKSVLAALLCCALAVIVPSILAFSCGSVTADGFCGDNMCGETEDCSVCSRDCGECQASCGDSICEGGEDCTSCANDCGSCSGEHCGDAMCNNGETCTSCPGDCGACPDVCSDGACTGAETCATCADDCGICPDEVCNNGMDDDFDQQIDEANCSGYY